MAGRKRKAAAEDDGGKECYYIGRKRYIPEESLLLCQYDGIFESVRLYRTKKGAFFTVSKRCDDSVTVSVLSEAAACKFMDEHATGIDKAHYDRVFGRPEKA